MSQTKLTLAEIKAKYCQPCDLGDSNEQELEVFTQDNGGGKYFVIKTDRWAIDNIEELVNLLNDFKKRME